MTGCRGRWLALSHVAAFAVAATGAAFAVYYLLPPLLAEPHLKASLARFGVILIAAFFLVILLSRFRRR